MKIYTIRNGVVVPGTDIEQKEINALGTDGKKIRLPVVAVGEEGRGRKKDFIVVEDRIVSGVYTCTQAGYLVGDSRCFTFQDGCGHTWSEGNGETCPKCGLTPHEQFKRNKKFERLLAADLGTTKSGKPKLVQETISQKEIIVVFHTRIGFRGSNSHSGDRKGWHCDSYSCDGRYTENVCPAPEKCPKCGGNDFYFDFLPFPGKIIAQGEIAQGAAGRAGSGEQIIAIMKDGDIFRTGYGGRLYGGPKAHYYQVKGIEIIGGLTWEERCASDLF